MLLLNNFPLRIYPGLIVQVNPAFHLENPSD